MDAKIYVCTNSFIKHLLVLTIILGGFTTAFAQDSTATGSSMGRIELPQSGSIQDLYTYDPVTDRYIYSQMLGNFDIGVPVILTPDEYRDLILRQEMREKNRKI